MCDIIVIKIAVTRVIFNIISYHCAVHGGWSSWVCDQLCSKTCGGGGTQKCTRSCSNPAPLCGGRKCSGSSGMTRVCTSDCCPGKIVTRPS